MGWLHHMERWEAGPEAVPLPQPDQSGEGTLLPAMHSDSTPAKLFQFLSFIAFQWVEVVENVSLCLSPPF